METAVTEELQATIEQELKLCYHCGHWSAESPFKFYNNNKLDQPRFQCCNCHKLFTWGFHGRAQGKTYEKKKNEDPEELRGLHRQCRHCGVADNAPFKYYNNNSLAQPRFKCLSCRKQFQMRLMGEGHERHLIHTGSTKQRRQKQGLAKTPPCNTLSTDGTMNSLCDEMLVPIDPYTTSGVMPYEDVELKNLIEAGLSEDTNEAPIPVHDVDMISHYSTNANVEYVPEMMFESAPPMDQAIIEDVFECDQSGPPLRVEDCYAWPQDLGVWDDTMEVLQAPYLEGCNISSIIPVPHGPLGEISDWSSIGSSFEFDDGESNEIPALELTYSID